MKKNNYVSDPSVSIPLKAPSAILTACVDADLVERLEFYAFQRHLIERKRLSLSKAISRILDEFLPELNSNPLFERLEICPVEPATEFLKREERVCSCVPSSLVERLDAECSHRGGLSRSRLIYAILSERLRHRPTGKESVDQIEQLRARELTRQRGSK